MHESDVLLILVFSYPDNVLLLLLCCGHRESSGEEGSGTDDDEETEDKQKQQQKIPDWARSSQLKEALERQYGLNGHIPVDPDTIFHEVQTCSLEEIFGCKEGKSGQ